MCTFSSVLFVTRLFFKKILSFFAVFADVAIIHFLIRDKTLLIRFIPCMVLNKPISLAYTKGFIIQKNSQKYCSVFIIWEKRQLLKEPFLFYWNNKYDFYLEHPLFLHRFQKSVSNFWTLQTLTWANKNIL